MSYYEPIGIDPSSPGSLKFPVPAGFTGQGSLWFADTAPNGWLICDGSELLIEDYPALHAVIGTTWGTPSTANHFLLPDLRQRVPVGKHSSGTFNALNNSGGAETHTLTSSEMPSHRHGHPNGGNWAYESVDVKSGVGGLNLGDSGSGSYVTGSLNGYGDLLRIENTAYTGGGSAHNNLQPYRVINFIIKT